MKTHTAPGPALGWCCHSQVTARGIPVAKGNLRTSRSGHSYYPNAAAIDLWASSIAAAAQGGDVGGVVPAPEALEVWVWLRVPRPAGHSGKRGLRPSAPKYVTTRPDADKYARAVLDALTGIAWTDDSQVVRLHVDKSYATDTEPAGVTVDIYHLL